MKLSYLFFLISVLFVFLLAPCVLAGVDVQLSKNVFNPGETLQAKVIIKDISLLNDLSVGNFVLFESSKGKQTVPLSLYKVSNNEYYVTLDLPVIKEGNFSFGLNNLKFFLSGELKQDSFFVSFATNSENYSVAIRPGYVSLIGIESYDQPTLTFSVKNFGSNTNISVSSLSDFLAPVLSRFSLSNGESKSLEVRTKIVGKIQDSFSGNLIVGYGNGFNYNIPVLITRKGFIIINDSSVNVSVNVSAVKNESVEEIVEDKNIVEYGSLILLSPKVKEVANTLDQKDKEPLTGEFTFKNVGNYSLEDIIVSYAGLEDVLTVSRNKIELLPSDSEFKLSIVVNASSAKLLNYKGGLSLTASNGVNLSIPFSFKVIFEQKKNEGAINISNVNVSNTNQSSLQIVAQEESSPLMSWIIVLAVIAAVLVVILVLYKKQKPKQEAYENLVDSFKRRT